jgi:hypothetical protein
LAIDAYIHADLAREYSLNSSGGLSQGDLFKIEAALASLAALLILLSARRIVWAFAFVVAASALAAVMIYANFDIGAIGPVPDMYEPLWYPEKRLAAIFEAVAAVTSAVGFFVAAHPRRSLRHRIRYKSATVPPSFELRHDEVSQRPR